MKVDTDTVTVVFGLLLNSSGMGALVSLLDIKDVTATLTDAIKPDRTQDAPDDAYVETKLAPLSKMLFSVPVILLHVLNIAFFVGIAAVLYVGPDKIFVTSGGARAEPLPFWELAVYWAWLFLLVLGYLVKGVSPTIELIRLRRKAKKWLAEYRARYENRRR